MTSAEGRQTQSRWSDLDRPPLNATALRRALVAPDGVWRTLDVVQVTGSTNSDLTARLREGTADGGTVLVAEEQSAGRGRLDRAWQAPARSGLFFSVALTPGPVPVARWSWLPLLAGVATATALARTAGVDTGLKWPNDLLVTVEGEERKTGGILAERCGDSVVIGIGVNVSLRADELPVPTAGSLALAGSPVGDRDPLLRAVLRALGSWYTRWRDAGGDPDDSRLREAYTAGCSTLGRSVRAELPGGHSYEGEAVAIDDDGRLVLSTLKGERAVGAGDVVHVRPRS
jgi:BirA family transcriptional regulator, biotin operon repressor / biotin---[acetyl-CoA-carboxylase] ligase